MKRVDNKVALVTGAAGAIASAILRRLGENGAKLVLTDQSDQGQQAADKLKADGFSATFVKHDVTSEQSWDDAVKHATDTYGRLDVLVNCAGVTSKLGQPFDSIPYEEWRRVMNVNLDGTFLGTRAGVRAMKTTGGGSIVNIGSCAVFFGTRGGAAYGASKGGVRTLTKQAAWSCAKHGYKVRINSIHPYFVWTPLIATRSIAEHGSEEAAKKKLAEPVPLGSLGEPDDVAWAVIYLASDESKFVTASDLIIDGGVTAS